MDNQLSVLHAFLEAKEWMTEMELAHWGQVAKLTDQQWVLNRMRYTHHCLSYIRLLQKHAKNPQYTIARYYNWLRKQKELACQKQRSLPLVNSHPHSGSSSDTPIALEQPAKRKRGRPRRNISWTLPT